MNIKLISLLKRCSFKMKVFLRGFLAGLITSITYLIGVGPLTFLYPSWAQIAGYPGIVMGWWAYDDLGFSEFFAEVVGCISLGVSHGLILLLITVIIKRFR